MLFLVIHTFISLLFISQNVSFLGNPVIYNNEFHTSCSMMLASNKSTNPYNLYISLGQEHYLEIPYNTTLILSFILTWITTVLILKQYSIKMGKIKYWILVSLPLIFFTMRYIDYFENFIIYFNLLDLLPIYIQLITYIESSPFYLLIKFNLLFGSLFFSMVFITIYSKLPKETMLRNTVLISALGMFLLFSSREIIGLFLPSYPPLGIMTVAFMAISSYLFFYGLFSTARIISRNSDLKKWIFNKIETGKLFIEDISAAENEIIIEKMVKSSLKNPSFQQDNKESPPLNEFETRQIINDIVEELSKRNLRNKKG